MSYKRGKDTLVKAKLQRSSKQHQEIRRSRDGGDGLSKLFIRHIFAPTIKFDLVQTKQVDSQLRRALAGFAVDFHRQPKFLIGSPSIC